MAGNRGCHRAASDPFGAELFGILHQMLDGMTARNVELAVVRDVEGSDKRGFVGAKPLDKLFHQRVGLGVPNGKFGVAELVGVGIAGPRYGTCRGGLRGFPRDNLLTLLCL